MIDFHSHILPGLDDGAPDLETALKMAMIAVEDGIEVMVATPHFIEGSIENDKELIIEKVNELQSELDKRKIKLKILPGAEVYMSPETHVLINQGELMTINNGGKYILIELPMQGIPIYANDVLFELKVQGITPVIAHPERNLELAKNPALIFDLAAKGCLIQINSGSISGLYGEKVKRTARLLVKEELVHLIGSDAHSTGGRSPRIKEALKVMENINTGITKDINGIGIEVLMGKEINMEVYAPSCKPSSSMLFDMIRNVLGFSS